MTKQWQKENPDGLLNTCVVHKWLVGLVDAVYHPLDLILPPPNFPTNLETGLSHSVRFPQTVTEWTKTRLPLLCLNLIRLNTIAMPRQQIWAQNCHDDINANGLLNIKAIQEQQNLIVTIDCLESVGFQSQCLYQSQLAEMFL